MATHQEAVTLEYRDLAIFMEVDFKSDDREALIDAIQTFRGRMNTYKVRFGDVGIGLSLAFGRDAWTMLSGNSASAPELFDLQDKGYGTGKATQRDMFVHIVSHRHNINYSLAKEFVEIFGDLVTVQEEVHGFRWLDARDLSGFIDGTENPKGEADRREVAVIGEGPDAGGSYVLAQRWEHHLEQFNHFDLKTQEEVFGRTKYDDIEMDDDEKPVGAHTERVVIEEDGEELEILRQSLPYGKASGTHGLYFLAYSAELSRIDKMLKMMFGEVDGEFDRMLSYTHAVTGSYLYAPSVEQLDELGED